MKAQDLTDKRHAEDARALEIAYLKVAEDQHKDDPTVKSILEELEAALVEHDELKIKVDANAQRVQSVLQARDSVLFKYVGDKNEG